MPDADRTKRSEYSSQVTASRLILFAQSLSVIASVSGLIGLVIAYRALKRTSTRTGTQPPPTIQ